MSLTSRSRTPKPLASLLINTPSEKHIKQKRSSRDRTPTTDRSSISPVIVTSRKKLLKQPELPDLQSRTPTPSKISLRANADSSRLGPGKYDVPKPPSGISYQFNYSPRFKLSRHSFLNALSRENSSEKIKKNLDLSSHYPDQKKKLILKQSKLKEIQSQQILQNKHKIDLAKRIEKQVKFQDKYRKFQLRINKYQEVKKTWVLFMCTVGLARSIKSKLKYKKLLKLRTNHRLQWLFNISRAVGKFKCLLISIREKKAFATLRVLMKPLLKVWVESKEKQLASVIAQTTQKVLSGPKMFYVAYLYKSKVLSLQRNLRRLFQVTRSRMTALRKFWCKVDLEMLPSNKPNKNLEQRLSIPNEVRDYYLRKYLNTRIKDYLENKNYFWRNKRQIDKDFFEERAQKELEAFIAGQKIEYKSGPSAPVLSLYSDKASMKELIQTAEKKRYLWDKIYNMVTGITTRRYQILKQNSAKKVTFKEELAKKKLNIGSLKWHRQYTGQLNRALSRRLSKKRTSRSPESSARNRGYTKH